MDDVIDRLAEPLIKNLKDETRQYWIAVAGAPGSGKSTFCKRFSEKLNSQGVLTTTIPMDGFHYYKHELDKMPNPGEAHSRRGSHWTFNSTKLVQVLMRLREVGSGSVPSFDHAIGDPVEDDISLGIENKIVFVEGNYLFLYDVDPWNALEKLFNAKWFISCDEARLRERVIARNSAAWGWDRHRTAARVDANDMPNAQLVASTARFADLVIDSIDDPSWI